MQNLSRLSRREFVRVSGAVVGTAGLARAATAENANLPTNRPEPDAVLARLLEGNKRFVAGKLDHPRRKPEDFLPLAEGQEPLAVIVGCADSRVAPELIFDQGVGDLFVVRVAGNVINGTGVPLKGSIEYAVAELHARLVIVLGHSQCGAVKAAIQHIDLADGPPGSIGGLVDLIKPAVAAVKGKPGDQLENAIRANVGLGVERLKGLEPMLAERINRRELKVVGAVYDLRTGRVNVLG
jgi:carbonic anhydrase